MIVEDFKDGARIELTKSEVISLFHSITGMVDRLSYYIDIEKDEIDSDNCIFALKLAKQIGKAGCIQIKTESRQS